MNTLCELNNKKHLGLKIKPETMTNFASRQHIVNINAQEIANAATCFPVFASRNTHDGAISFSAMMSFELNTNLFVENNKWMPVYIPVGLQTHPVYLMQSPRDNKSYTYGILEGSDDFSSTQGSALFDENGQTSDTLKRITGLLQGSVEQTMQTQQFVKDLNALDLFKALDLNVQYQSGHVQKIQGLMTINEERLQSLSSEELAALHKKGYLTPIHAMLVSIYQVNVLVNKHNIKTPSNTVAQVKMEVSKEAQLV